MTKFRDWMLLVLFGTLSYLESQGQDAASATIAPSKDIIVMSANLRTPKAADSALHEGWTDRKDLCIETIRNQHPDIIGFQECSKAQFDDLHAAFPDYLTFGVNGESPLSDDPYEVIFVSPRFSLVTGASYWLSEAPNVPGSKSWDNSKHPRVVNWMRLRDKNSGVQFRILNTHFDQKGQIAREMSAAMVVADAKAFPADFPQILTGDLNADQPNKALDILKEGGWLDTWATLYGSQQPGFTAHDFLGDKFVPKGKLAHAGKIDWIFCRGDVTPVSSKIIRDQKDGIYPSDHYFLVADLKIATPK
jgi:endonuclease/exonuclease/phosphatase family metal-dependent hydrolase